MFWLNGNKMRLAVAGMVFIIFLYGGQTRADFTFGEPVNMGPNDDEVGPTVNLNCSNDYGPHVSADGLELYFTSTRTGQTGCIFGDSNIWLSTRPTTDDPWGPPQKLGPSINTSKGEGSATVSADGLEMYFERWYQDADSKLHASVWVTRRPSPSDPWGEPTQLDLLGDGKENEGAPALSADGLELYFTYADFEGKIGKLYVAKRDTVESPWNQPVGVGPAVNDYGCQAICSISSDGLVLVFNDWWNCSPRPDGFGGRDIWLARRATQDGEWEPPVNLGPLVNTAFSEVQPMISADGSTLYFGSDRPGGSGWGNLDLWQAPILPVVDFDGDGNVGISDLTLMVDAWGTDNSRYDIGPMPWGDGLVDEVDLEVLMNHWGQSYPVDQVNPFVVVDDFENYNDDIDAGTTIWQIWIDAFVNGTGSLSGHEFPTGSTYGEIFIVHTGRQAMPLTYDNDGTLFDGREDEMTGLLLYSEVQRTWEEPQDWTRKGVETLVLWFHGDPDNSIEPMYILLEDDAGKSNDVMYTDPAAITAAHWQQWSINLSEFVGVDLTAITKMSIGVGDKESTEPGGSGIVYIDDIQLHRPL